MTLRFNLIIHVITVKTTKTYGHGRINIAVTENCPCIEVS